MPIMIINEKDKSGPTIENLRVTQNGVYQEANKAYSPVVVDVPEKVLKTKTITDNGDYSASSDNADGYSSVNVNVPLSNFIKSATGAVASFTDGTDTPLNKLKVGIEPQQDLHGYDKPWSGGAGVNKYPNSAISDTDNAVTVTQNGEEYILSGTATAYSQFISRETFTLEAGTYTLKEFNGINGIYVQLRSVDGQTTYASAYVTDSNPFTLSDATEVKARIIVTANVTTNRTIKLMIVNGSTAPSDYSPYSNICPISGWDEAKIEKCGKNLVYNVLSNSSVDSTGKIGTSDSFDMACAKIKQGITYTITTDDGMLVCGFFTSEPQIGSITYNDARLVQNSKTFVAPIDGYVIFRALHGYATPQIELGTTATAYEPYNPNSTTYTIDLDGTRYGGTLDVGSGVLTVTKGYIASYNGETLPSTWISDRDVYASGTTPTTGAEVVYELATPLTIQLNPTQVRSLLGNNNIFADTGDVLECEYFGE